MDVFNRNHRGFIITESFFIVKIFCVALFSLSMAFTASAQDEGSVAVLPLMIKAQETPDDLSSHLQEILGSTISDKGYWVIPADTVNKHPLAFRDSMGDSDLVSIGQDLGADWVVSGAFLKSDDKISLDIKIIGTASGRSPFSMSMAADNMDKISDTADKIAEGMDYYISGISIIANVNVQGNKRIESDAILANIDTEKGDIYDQSVLNQDVRAIIAMGYFKDVQVDEKDEVNGKGITFIVEEKPYITKIAFEGNKKYKEDELIEEIGIKKFAVLNLSDVKESINTLKEFYKKKGYYNATITDRVDELPNNESSLTYVIDEGEKVHITKLEFLGNEVYSDKKLKKLIKTNKKGMFSFITNSGVLEQNKLDYDVYQLTNFYHNEGYIQAQIGDPEVTYDKEEGLTVAFTIDESNRYKVGDVHIVGDLIKAEEELLEKINLNKQEYISRQTIYDDIEVLKNIYADEGYAYADVNRIMQDDENTLEINTTYTITKKKKVRIERIDIKGNTNTRDKVIRRGLKLIEGDYFSSSKLEKSKTNLTRLEYLEDPEIKIKDGSSDDLMVLDVEVTEKLIGQFSIGAGYSSFDKLFASLAVSLENLFGRGQSISIEGSVGSRTTEYDLQFTEPWLFDKNVSGSISLYNLETEYDDFIKDSWGGALGVGFLMGIDDYTRGSISYSYDKAYISSGYYYYSSPYLQDMLGTNIKSSITTGIGRDTRDRLWGTSKGSLNTITLEYAGGFLGGTSDFNKITASSSWFFPIWWNHVLMFKGIAGIVDARGGGKLPVYEKFNLGGTGSVRGYDTYSISPVDTETGYKIGGDKMWIGNFEYRIPVTKEQGVYGYLFFDAGNAFKKVNDWRKRGKRSYGFGIKWYSPMGPINLYYSFPLDEERGEDAGGFEFDMSY